MKSQSGFIPLWAFVLMFTFVLFMSNAYASGGHDHCGHGNHPECAPSPEPEPTPDPGPVVVNKKGDAFTGKNFGVSILIGCGVTSVYQGFANSRWRWPYQWCLDLFKAAPPTTITPSATAFGINVEIKK